MSQSTGSAVKNRRSVGRARASGCRAGFSMLAIASIVTMPGVSPASAAPAHQASQASGPRYNTRANPATNTEVPGCPSKGGTLNVDLDEDVLADLDPSYEPAAVAYRVDRGVFDSLLYEDSAGKYSPWLASSWTVSPNKEHYTFVIRKGATFSDGTPVNAAAVKFTFDRIENPNEGSLFAISLLGPYQGSVLLPGGKVEVNFTRPYPDFLEAASQAFLGIVSPTAVNKAVAAAHGNQRVGYANFGLKPVGSGPFEITSNVVNQQIVEVARPAYNWGPAGLTHKGPACLGKIVFAEVPELSTRVGQLMSGQVGAAETILPPDYQEVQSNPSLNLYVVPGAGAGYQMLINTQEAPWNSVAMRKAFREAIDLPAILQAVYQGEYIQAWGPIMPHTAYYDPGVENSWKYDAKAADATFKSLGWKVGRGGYRYKDGKELTMTFAGLSPDRELRQEVSDYVQSYEKKVGVNFSITNYSVDTALSVLEKGDYGSTATSFITASPSIMYDFFNSAEIPHGPVFGQSLARLDVPQINTWTAEANQATTAALERALWDKVQTYVVANAVTIPVTIEPYILGLRNNVHGLVFDRRDYPMWYGVWLGK